MARRVFLLGIDGGSWRLLAPFLEKGEMPNLKRIRNSSAWTDLESLLPPLSPLAWTTIFTGVGPDKHKIFSFVTQRENSYLIRPICSQDRKAPPIWQHLSQKGKEVVLINIPFSYPPDSVNGVMVSGLGSPSTKSNFTYPEKLKKVILEKFPGYDVDYNEDLLMRGIEEERFLEIVKNTTSAQMEFSKYIIESQNAELIIFIIRSLDVIFHYFWHRDDIILNFCKQIDDYLGWVLTKLDTKEDALIICSDHGFCNSHSRFYVNNWLKELGLFKIQTHETGAQKLSSKASEYIVRKLVEKNLKNLVWNLKRMSWTAPLIKFIKPPSVRTLCKTIWKNTKAYYQEGSEGVININLKGREPEGIVEENEFEQLREEIIQEAIRFVDSRNGQKVFETAKRGEEVYHCSRQSDIPDIVLVRNEGYTLKGYGSGKDLFENISHRNGEHHPTGMVCFFGDVFNKGKVAYALSIKDIAPMTLRLLGVSNEVSDMASSVFGDIVRSDMLKKDKEKIFNKKKGTPSTGDERGGRQVYTKDQEELIKKRLEGLGYI